MSDWKRDDTVILVDTRGIHVGKAATLVERKLGKIAGRAYWTLRLENGAITSEFEDSLVRAEARPPAMSCDNCNSPMVLPEGGRHWRCFGCGNAVKARP